MEFQFENKVSAWDMWKLSMYHIYHSMVGLSNIVFSVAIILLTVKLWNPEQELLMSLLVLCCVFFPIMQPLSVYFRAAKQVAALPKNMNIQVNETGIHVSAEDQKAHVPWNRVKGIIKERGMVILAADAGRGYMLTDKMLGEQKEAFLEFVELKIVKNK